MNAREYDAVFDSYVIQLHQCETVGQFDEVMEAASMDSDVPAYYFLRLCDLARAFMDDLRLFDKITDAAQADREDRTPWPLGDMIHVLPGDHGLSDCITVTREAEDFADSWFDWD